jgi:hypothetical protein
LFVLTRNVALVCATGALTVLGTGLIVSSADAAPPKPVSTTGVVLTCTQVATSKVYICTQTGTVPTPAPAPTKPAPQPTRPELTRAVPPPSATAIPRTVVPTG